MWNSKHYNIFLEGYLPHNNIIATIISFIVQIYILPPCIFDIAEFLSWVTGGVGLCDCPVALYIAMTQRLHSFSSSQANAILSPSRTALKKYRPPFKSMPNIKLAAMQKKEKDVCYYGSKVFTYRSPLLCNQLCIHPIASFPMAQTSSLCSYTLRMCTGTPELTRNTVSSTSSKLIYQLHEGTCK